VSPRWLRRRSARNQAGALQTRAWRFRGYGRNRRGDGAGSYRLALGRNETHIVENRSDLSGDFLQVEKTEIDPKTFNGRKVREESTDRSRTSSKVEFDAAQLRIVRVFCAGAMTCEPREAVVPALVVDLRTGDVRRLTPSAGVNGNNHASASGEYLKIEFKGKPLPAHD
jgi:hypothetical protein